MADVPPLPQAPNVQLPDSKAQAQNVNPSVRTLSIAEQIEKGLRKRVSMAIPTRKLEVPEIPGYWLYWFIDRNVPKAIDAGYEFVDVGEIPLTQHNPGNSKDIDGNMDMGTRVTQIGGKGENGQPEHLILMKLREEWAAEDRGIRDQRNAKILSAIFKGEDIPGSEGMSRQDKQLRYVKQADLQTPSPPRNETALMQRPPRKRV